MTWQQTPPDKPGIWVRIRTGAPSGTYELNQNCNWGTYSAHDLHFPGDWWYGPLPEKPAPALKPGLLRWEHFDGSGEAVLFSDGHVMVQHAEGCGGWSITHHKTVDACRDAGYTLTQD